MATSKYICHSGAYIFKGEDECQHDTRDEQDHAEDEQHTLVWCHVELDE